MTTKLTVVESASQLKRSWAKAGAVSPRPNLSDQGSDLLPPGSRHLGSHVTNAEIRSWKQLLEDAR